MPLRWFNVWVTAVNPVPMGVITRDCHTLGGHTVGSSGVCRVRIYWQPPIISSATENRPAKGISFMRDEFAHSVHACACTCMGTHTRTEALTHICMHMHTCHCRLSRPQKVEPSLRFNLRAWLENLKKNGRRQRAKQPTRILTPGGRGSAPCVVWEWKSWIDGKCDLMEYVS